MNIEITTDGELRITADYQEGYETCFDFTKDATDEIIRFIRNQDLDEAAVLSDELDGVLAENDTLRGLAVKFWERRDKWRDRAEQAEREVTQLTDELNAAKETAKRRKERCNWLADEMQSYSVDANYWVTRCQETERELYAVKDLLE